MAFHNNHKKKPEVFYRSSRTIEKQKDFDLNKKEEEKQNFKAEKEKAGR